MDNIFREINKQGLDTENNGWIMRSVRQKGSEMPMPLIFSGEMKYDAIDRGLGLVRHYCPIDQPWWELN